MTGRLAGLLLAAGEGRRFGAPKALVAFRGEPLVARGVRLLQVADCEPIVVVVGAVAEEVRAAVPVGAEVVENPAWGSGMGSSFQAGLSALDGRADAVVVALADQPLVHPEAIRRLVAAWSGGALAAVATYDGRHQNPVLLDLAVWPAARALAVGDRGARAFLRARPELVTAVPCDGFGSAVDIDTPGDLAALASRSEQEQPCS